MAKFAPFPSPAAACILLLLCAAAAAPLPLLELAGAGRAAACPQCYRTASDALNRAAMSPTPSTALLCRPQPRCYVAKGDGCAWQVIDLNTFTTEELQQAMQAGLRYDGVWMIPENSPQVQCTLLLGA